MFSTVLGWILIGLGIASYVMALVILVKTLLTRPAAKKAHTLSNPDLEPVCDLLDKIVKLLESFAKLSVPVQWAVLGLLNIGIGAYLIASQPF
jgi:hypothetical protein